ncbi:hypothetical protein Pmani_006316 [Petrolisthes manimaculis]|uniref:Uncharacterized protein n=1 Tax=Petrolisthes manimaculis TaxID=1843537 RepID=A0AAE1QA31_9EUCA|nr:hypothetical protein Pmani_006316 [Petrolisthes manimaculis]
MLMSPSLKQVKISLLAYHSAEKTGLHSIVPEQKLGELETICLSGDLLRVLNTPLENPSKQWTTYSKVAQEAQAALTKTFLKLIKLLWIGYCGCVIRYDDPQSQKPACHGGQ